MIKESFYAEDGICLAYLLFHYESRSHWMTMRKYSLKSTAELQLLLVKTVEIIVAIVQKQ